MGLKAKQLREFLKDYDDNADVILGDGSEIKHIGMTRITTKGYSVVLATETPKYCCDVCGNNVYKRDDSDGLGQYYCPTCDNIKHHNELIPLKK